jgi:hypothetical protein
MPMTSRSVVEGERKKLWHAAGHDDEAQAEVNGAKMRVSKLPEEKFGFSGYTFGFCYPPKTGRAYLGTVPAEGDQHLSGDQQRNRTQSNPIGSHWSGNETQPHDDGLGALLLPRSGQQSLSGRGSARPQTASQVVVQ